jgi:hypothetical protein
VRIRRKVTNRRNQTTDLFRKTQIWVAFESKEMKAEIEIKHKATNPKHKEKESKKWANAYLGRKRWGESVQP